MKILTKKKVDEILLRIAANEIIQIECDKNDVAAAKKIIENRSEIAYLVGGIDGMVKVQEIVKAFL